LGGEGGTIYLIFPSTSERGEEKGPAQGKGKRTDHSLSYRAFSSNLTGEGGGGGEKRKAKETGKSGHSMAHFLVSIPFSEKGERKSLVQEE